MQSVEQKTKHLGYFVELADEETLLVALVIHITAKLLDALSMAICLIGGVLALDELNDLVEIHL